MSAPLDMPATLPELLLRVFEAERERTGLVLPGRDYRFGEILDGALRAAGWFRSLGLRPGDRIAAHMPPTFDSVLCFLAGLFCGTTLVPLNPRYTEQETSYFLDDAGARLFLRQGGPASAGYGPWRVLIRSKDAGFRQQASGKSLRSLSADSPPVRADLRRPRDEVALLCYTSGTTGRPKGAMITHGNLAAMAASLHQAWGWRPRDVLLHALPLFHVHGLLVALQGALYAGAGTVLVPGFDPEDVLDRLVRDRPTLFMGVPTMYRRLLCLENPTPLPLDHVRLFVSGSAPLAVETFHAFRERFGHTLLERYGMTEAGMVLSNPLRGKRKPGSVGLPLPGVSVRIVDPATDDEVAPGQPGELLIRSGSVCKGYWGRADATAEAFTADGWLRSGDMARQDEDGYVSLVSRRKEIVITGGFNVYPKEVESVLEGHPAVSEAAVYGVPDPDLGEQVRAAVVLHGTASPSGEELIAFCKGSLTSYKCPRAIRFLEDLPRNPMGKVVKERLKDKG